MRGQAAAGDQRRGLPSEERLIAAMMLQRIGCLTAVEKLRLFDRCADVDAVAWLTPHAMQEVSARRLRAVPEDPGRLIEAAERERSRLTQLGGGCILYASERDAPLLTAIHDSPFLLYYRGHHPELLSFTKYLSVMGTRRPSDAGRRARGRP